MQTPPLDRREAIKHSWLRSTKKRFLSILLIVLGLVLCALGVVLWRHLQKAGDRASEEFAEAITELVEGMMVTENPGRIQDTLEEVIHSSSVITGISVVNTEDTISFSSNPGEVGSKFDLQAEPSCSGCHAGDVLNFPLGHDVTTLADGQSVRRHVHVLRNKAICQTCHDPSVPVLGTLMVDRSLGGNFLLMVQVLGTIVVASLIVLPFTGAFFSKSLDRYIREIDQQDEELTSLYVLVDRLSKTIDVHELRGVIASLLSELLRARRIHLVAARKTDPPFSYYEWREREGALVRQQLDPDAPELEVIYRWLDDPESKPEITNDGKCAWLPVGGVDGPLLLLIARDISPPLPPSRAWFLEVVAGHIAAAYENARLYTLAMTDELTGVFARRHFEYTLPKELARHQDSGASLSLLFFDIDDFKQLNDRHGHPAGDAVLRAVAAAISESVRAMDTVSRYGGEEFAVLLPGTAVSQAVRVAERIRERVAGTRNDAVPNVVTISGGVAASPAHAKTAPDLMKKADQALYKAKQIGKNRIVAAYELEVIPPESD
ncbi:MAG: GGDEF domain-containing protein [Candidatus Hydrogenedentes bacterium]|nr:GGDEF domain-containing protein [Candidatus Hydrogenedentota bacterium]